MIFCVTLNSCAYSAKKEDLNGTWMEVREKTEPQMRDSILKLHTDPNRKHKFTWGDGVTSVNTSWDFDLGEQVNQLYDSWWFFKIIVVENIASDELKLKVIDAGEFENIKDKPNKVDIIEQQSETLKVKFLNKNRIIITSTPGEQHILNGGSQVLYRLSGPNMKLQPDGTLK